MALHRTSASLASAFLRSTRVSTPHSTPSLCPRCMRRYPIFATPSRLASTAAYRPQSLDTPSPPPRNADIPDTSIAGNSSTSGDQAAPPDTWAGKPPPQPTGPVSLPEAEAQQPHPTQAKAVGSMASEISSTSKEGKKKPKLRPRKAALTLSPAAVEQLRDLLNQPDPKLIRVGVKNRGCSGLAYHLEYVEKPGTFDEAVEQDGVKVLVDSKALFSIIGSEMDWTEDKLSRRFVFKNPNITEQCGCGESFSIG